MTSSLTRFCLLPAFLASIAPLPLARAATPDKYHITGKEKAACTTDAMRFCLGTYPDEDALLACMKQNHASLTTLCRVAFDAGIRRRNL